MNNEAYSEISLDPVRTLYGCSPKHHHMCMTKLDLRASIRSRLVHPVSLLNPLADDSLVGQRLEPPLSVEIVR